MGLLGRDETPVVPLTSPKDLQYWRNYDPITFENPHAGDPRHMLTNQAFNCTSRYITFCRCCRELGEDHPRCKYQYYRAEIACTSEFLDMANTHRAEGRLLMDTLPDRRLVHMRQ